VAGEVENAVDVAIGALVEPVEGRLCVLVTRRLDGAACRGCWELPGGKIEPGETAGGCLVREFREEVGLVVELIAPLPVVVHRYPHARVRLHPFYCRRRAGEIRHLQVADHRWVRPDTLADLDLPRANEPITRQLQADLR
jgi:mutator protein MutT